MSIFDTLKETEHEQVIFCYDKETGLKAIIGIHNTNLGPALGGCRVLPYATEEEAITDVLRLSRGMSYKSAIAGINLGGGKSVIIADPKKHKTEGLFRSFGKFVDTLEGRYITAEDVNTSVEDMDFVRMETRYVTGIDKALGGSGDPSPITAWGVFWGMKAAWERKTGRKEFKDVTVAVQGVGHVGYHLCRFLNEEGARLIVCDMNQEAVNRVVTEFNATAVGVNEIYDVTCDIYAPCALGATLNETTIPKLKCCVVAGAANNQLKMESDADELLKRGILYAPDYLVNAGGVISVYNEFTGITSNEYSMNMAQRRIYSTSMKVYDKAEKEGISTHLAANRIAEERMNMAANIKTIFSPSHK